MTPITPKRVLDLVGSLILLLLTAPLLLGIALTPAGTLVRQTRAGLGGRPFRMLKFRTRLRFSLDELPQLVNVLRGEMSLVGPRPLPPDAPEQTAAPARLLMRPGITGLWQVSGRSELPWEEMAVLDLHYVEQCWLGLDLAILARTVPAIARARDRGRHEARREGCHEGCLSDADHRPRSYSAAE
ncbi:hypothetical protein GCM10020367_33820 [Streptomyces sannanensis]|uniref:Bacterial sugar transferase domain-containing protein n=1 Tax=Streptomyces sannanensis TaxID=285536 RepID=A0ABP6SD13_9ACTN